MEKYELIVILGNVNDKHGRLSADALARITLAEQVITGRPDSSMIRLVTTGGYGGYFNESNRPHGRLQSDAIDRRGQMKGIEILSHVHSSGTHDDALGVLRLVRRMEGEPSRITVVTNGYHKQRSEFIFARVFPDTELDIVADANSGTPEQQKHEARALRMLKAGSLPNISTRTDNLDGATEQLFDELKHYDNLSYLALAASFVILFIWVDKAATLTSLFAKGVSFAIALAISCLVFSMYYRLAGTASSARRTISAVSTVLAKPNLGTSRNMASARSLPIVRSAFLGLALSWLAVFLVSFDVIDWLVQLPGLPVPLPPTE